MPLFQQATPDTTAYMVGGFAVIFGVMLVYMASILIRRRNLDQDLQILEDIEDEE